MKRQVFSLSSTRGEGRGKEVLGFGACYGYFERNAGGTGANILNVSPSTLAPPE